MLSQLTDSMKRKTSSNKNCKDSQENQKWDDFVKVQAAFLLRDKILDHLKIVEEMDTLIAHTNLCVAARMHSRNKIGATIFMKLVLQYEAQRDKAQHVVSELRKLAMKIRHSESYINYEAKINEVTSARTKVDTTDGEGSDKDHVLNTIQLRLNEVTLEQPVPRAA